MTSLPIPLVGIPETGEEWRAIAGYEARYEVSTLGRVRSLARVSSRGRNGDKPVRERILKPARNRSGYLHVTLCLGGRDQRKLIHQLVAEAFLPNPQSKPAINHISGIKTDNRLVNLERVTFAENSQHAIATGLWVHARGRKVRDAKLTETQVAEIRALYDAGCPLGQIAAKYGVGKPTVCKIGKRKRWKHVI